VLLDGDHKQLGKKFEMCKIKALGLFFIVGNHDNFGRDAKGLYLDIWVSFRNQKGLGHLGCGMEFSHLPTQLEDKLSPKEGRRCYGQAFGSS
jgi:calcineurin-like phosphoesterase family protein